MVATDVTYLISMQSFFPLLYQNINENVKKKKEAESSTGQKDVLLKFIPVSWSGLQLLYKGAK